MNENAIDLFGLKPASKLHYRWQFAEPMRIFLATRIIHLVKGINYTLCNFVHFCVYYLTEHIVRLFYTLCEVLPLKCKSINRSNLQKNLAIATDITAVDLFIDVRYWTIPSVLPIKLRRALSII